MFNENVKHNVFKLLNFYRSNCLFGNVIFLFLSSAVYLNVTNIETFDIDHDKFCIKWTPHRAATSYRIKLNPMDRKSLHYVTFTSTELKQTEIVNRISPGFGWLVRACVPFEAHFIVLIYQKWIS